jgi:hypothetical protein
MSMRQRPTRKQNGAPKKARSVQNNSSNVQGNNRPRKQANARRDRQQPQNQGSSFMNPVSVSSAYATGVSSTKPRIITGNQMCNVRHKEFIGNISGLNNQNFNQSFALALNPGIASTFPWLAIMAQNWQAYRFKKMRFFYFTRTGSTTVGSVILCPDYDAADVAPISEQVIDSYEDAKEDAPWKNLDCPLNSTAMHLMGPKKFIRLGPLSANQDIKTYDVGNMFVYTVDSAAAASWGKLWVEYDVDLFTPQLPPGGSSFTQTAVLYGKTAQTAALPFGTAPQVFGNMQVVVGNNGTNNTITLSNAVVGGEYALQGLLTGTVITQAPNIVSLTGGTAGTDSGGFSAAATSAWLTYTFIATSSTVVIVFDTTATTITDAAFTLALIPANGLVV